MKLVCAIFLLLLSCFGVGTAYADSDGYYCTGPDYLAYQFGFAPPPVGTHRLHILRFGNASGIEAPLVVELPQFQVHGILCAERSVRLAAYDAIYTVQLDETHRPVRYDSVASTDRGRTPPEFVGHSSNLGAWNKVASTLGTDRIALGPANGGGQYLLEIRGTAIGSECASMVTTRVVRTDRNGREVQQAELFRGRGVRDCGGHAIPEGVG